MSHDTQTCRDSQRPPNLIKGETQESGSYYRNLKKGEVGLHYSEAPAFGHRVKSTKARKWNWQNEHGLLDLSVNEKVCTGDPACSILIHPKKSDYQHVWEIDLVQLNTCLEGVDDAYVAQYHPVDGNQCHFVLLSKEGNLSNVQILSVLNRLEQSLPPEDKEKLPKGKVPPRGHENVAQEAAEKYSRLIRLHLNPVEQE